MSTYIRSSILRELDRIKKLGGSVRITMTTIVIDLEGLIPISTGEIFKRRIERADTESRFTVSIKQD